jgi:epoxyqueuosine reductase
MERREMVMTSASPATSLEHLIKAQAFGIGFDLVGITSLGPAESAPAFERWLDAGYAGEMDYLTRGAEKRRDSSSLFAGASSAIVVALDYGGRTASGPVARYARGFDYHDIMKARLRFLHSWIERQLERRVSGRAYVDTGPLLERDLARRAGLGWFGKNTNLVNPSIGSFFFIGALLVDLDLAPDAPFEADRCGTCTRCLEACPTDAFVSPRELDATKCISYLTIELRGPIPTALRDKIGEHIYGCDICQDVCPWNVSFAQELREEAFTPRGAIAERDARSLARSILEMDEASYRLAFKGSAMKRAKRRGLARNAAVVLGNVGEDEDIGALEKALDDDADPLLREHAKWALGKVKRRATGN